MMKFLVFYVERADNIFNLPHFIFKCWMPQHFIDVYYTVNHLFEFPRLESNIRYAKIFWET